MANLQFDARQVAPDTGFDVIPAGWYKVLVTESEIKPTKDGQGMYLAVTYTILDGQYKGRKLFGRFNLKNNNPTAQEIGYKQLSALAHAVGVLQVADSSQLHNIPLQVRVKIRPAQAQYDESNDIVSWKNINEQVGAVAANQAPAFAAPVVPPAQAQQYAPPAQQAPVQQPQGQWQPQAQAQPPAAPQWAPPAGQAPQQTQQFAPQAQQPQQQQQQQQQAAPAWAPPAGQQQWQQPQGQPQQQAAPAQQAPVQQPQGVSAAQTAPPPWAQPRT